MEGLYRVPGNRAHVETLFARLAEDPNTILRSLDIPVNAVATALKDFLAKRLPPPIPTDMMAEIERVQLSCFYFNFFNFYFNFLLLILYFFRLR